MPVLSVLNFIAPNYPLDKVRKMSFGSSLRRAFPFLNLIAAARQRSKDFKPHSRSFCLRRRSRTQGAPCLKLRRQFNSGDDDAARGCFYSGLMRALTGALLPLTERANAPRKVVKTPHPEPHGNNSPLRPPMARAQPTLPPS